MILPIINFLRFELLSLEESCGCGCGCNNGRIVYYYKKFFSNVYFEKKRENDPCLKLEAFIFFVLLIDKIL
jgi:hypothetical protein